MKISPFLWFDHQAEEAARFYTAIFESSFLSYSTTRIPKNPREPFRR
jgi:predicted 3-demethylubiquinone-9 3-methyltransferase (glyoxalase superfamily)